jgi:hypothetical protein
MVRSRRISFEYRNVQVFFGTSVKSSQAQLMASFLSNQKTSCLTFRTWCGDRYQNLHLQVVMFSWHTKTFCVSAILLLLAFRFPKIFFELSHSWIVEH